MSMSKTKKEKKYSMVHCYCFMNQDSIDNAILSFPFSERGYALESKSCQGNISRKSLVYLSLFNQFTLKTVRNLLRKRTKKYDTFAIN